MRRFDKRIRKAEGPVQYHAEPKLDGSALKLACVEGVLDRAVTQGHFIGSSIFSLAAVLGAAALNECLSIASGVLGRGFPAMLILSAPVWLMARRALHVGRWQGFFLPVLYALFWLWLGGST